MRTDDQREENSITLPKEKWAEIAARAETNSCGISDIIERAWPFISMRQAHLSHAHHLVKHPPFP